MTQRFYRSNLIDLIDTCVDLYKIVDGYFTSSYTKKASAQCQEQNSNIAGTDHHNPSFLCLHHLWKAWVPVCTRNHTWIECTWLRQKVQDMDITHRGRMKIKCLNRNRMQDGTWCIDDEIVGKYRSTLRLSELIVRNNMILIWIEV